MDRILYPIQSEYLSSFRKKDNELLFEMEEYARSNNVPILSWDSAEFIEMLVHISRPRRVLELGTAIAYTTIRIASCLKKKALVHTIEKSAENIVKAREYIARSGSADKIKIFEGEAFDVLPQLKKKYDFIFLDADKEDYMKLLDYSVVLLKKGGILFVDNLLWKGYTAASRVPKNFQRSTRYIREFNKAFMSRKNLKAAILPVGDGIGLAIKQKSR